MALHETDVAAGLPGRSLTPDERQALALD